MQSYRPVRQNIRPMGQYSSRESVADRIHSGTGAEDPFPAVAGLLPPQWRHLFLPDRADVERANPLPAHISLCVRDEPGGFHRRG